MRAARLSDLRAPRTARVPTHQQCAMQKQDSPYECGGLGAQVIGNFWLSDQQFALIQPHLPYRAAGRRRADDRRIISGILHVLQSGCRWQDCPDVYGPHTTVYNRFNRWSQRGIWQYLFAALTSELAGTPDEISIDTTHVKAHRCAGGGKGGLLLRRLAAPKAAVTLRSTP